MAQELTERGNLIPAAIDERIKEIETVVKDCDLIALGELGELQRAFKLARGVQRLRELITPEMLKDMMALQNTPLGFLTDKQDTGYPVAAVRDVTIEALVRGFRMTNNEVNIIAGRFYGAKNGFMRKVASFPGLTDFRPLLGVPRIVNEKGALVEISATWKLNGRPDEYVKREIPIRVNAGMGADAILGKATRKLLAAIYAQVSGTEVPEGEPDEETAVRQARDVTPEKTDNGGSKSDALAERLKQAPPDAKVPAAKAEQPANSGAKAEGLFD